MAKELGRGEGFSWPWDIFRQLPEEVESGAVFPLQDMYADIVRRHPGPPNAPVCGLYQIDCDLTLYISARPRVGLPPLCCEATGYLF